MSRIIIGTTVQRPGLLLVFYNHNYRNSPTKKEIPVLNFMHQARFSVSCMLVTSWAVSGFLLSHPRSWHRPSAEDGYVGLQPSKKHPATPEKNPPVPRAVSQPNLLC